MHTNRSTGTRVPLDTGVEFEVLDAIDEMYYFLSPEGELLQWNDRFPSVTGYDHAEIESMSAVDFFPQEHHARISAAHSTILSEKREVTVEADILTTDGRRVPHEFSGKPVYEDGESLAGIVGIGRDISQRRHQERLVDTITETVPIVLFAVDADGVFTLSRGQGLDALGLEPGEVVGESAFDVYADAPEIRRDLERALDGEQFRSTVEFADTAFETVYRPIVRNGAVEQVVGVSIDVTDRYEYERKLEDTTERLEILNRMVRHDIRNDLMVLLPWAREIRTERGEDDESIQRVIDAGRHIRDLTETAQEYVDVITDDEAIDTRPLELEPALREEVELRRSMYEDARFEVDEPIPDVQVAANELLPTVFRNLLNNAVQHNDSDTPEVRIAVAADGDTVRVDIADDGPGIPDDRKVEIFGKGDRSLDDRGTGIGLYLVYTLVDRYGGDVWVEDNTPRGSIFRVELPAA